MSAEYGVLSCNVKMQPSLVIDQNLIIYIPSISNEISTEFVSNLFRLLGIATVSYIHLQQIDNLTNEATVYMNHWYHNQCVENLQEKINDPSRQARLIYDDPNYWILYNRATLFNESSSLHNKVSYLESKIDKTNDLLETQAKQIESLSRSFAQLSSRSTNKRKQAMYKNNSCCGAASDAWVPSYPQTETSWGQRLRRRQN